MRRKEFEAEYREVPEQDCYRTGHTEPPRHQNGLVAILLVLVVFLAGMTSILSVLNIRLFSELYDQKLSDKPAALANIQNGVASTAPEKHQAQQGVPGMGIHVDEITAVYQRHFQLPEGLFITHVKRGSDAEKQGLQEGDVLLYLGNTRLNREEQLTEAITRSKVGDQVQAVVYRSSTNERLSFLLTVEEIVENEN